MTWKALAWQCSPAAVCEAYARRDRIHFDLNYHPDPEAEDGDHRDGECRRPAEAAESNAEVVRE
jgi:hypothetical protein